MRTLPMALCLVLTGLSPTTATGDTLWSWTYGTMGLSTPANPSPLPADQIYGHVPLPGEIGEVAVAHAIIRSGELVPLPNYGDGTPAAENEIFWTARLWRAQFPAGYCRIAPWPFDGDRCDIQFANRLLSTTRAIVSNTDIWCSADRSGWESRDVEVLVTVIAVRAMATGTSTSTWGGVKNRYR